MDGGIILQFIKFTTESSVWESETKQTRNMKIFSFLREKEELWRIITNRCVAGQHRPGPGDPVRVPGGHGEPGGDDGPGDAQAQGHPEDRGQRRLPHQAEIIVTQS